MPRASADGPPAFGPLAGLVRAIAASQPELQSLGRRIDAALSSYLKALPGWSERIAEINAKLQAGIAQWLAPNWRGLNVEQLGQVVYAMRDSGINLAWAPPQGILIELLDATDDERRNAVLVERGGAIRDSLHGVLDEVSYVELFDARDAARECLDAHEAGHGLAAQALATVLLGNLVHDVLDHAKFKHAYNNYRRFDPEDTDLRELRLRSVLACLARASAGEDLPGDDYRRNRSAHRVTDTQYTPANALIALLLVVGLMRELAFWLEGDESS
jgi:hypothetical protein